jgi:hypothetical protein
MPITPHNGTHIKGVLEGNLTYNLSSSPPHTIFKNNSQMTGKVAIVTGGASGIFLGK